MTRTLDDTFGYGGDAPAYEVHTDCWCRVCRAAITWPDAPLRHSEAHTRDRVTASERRDAEQAELARELRRERDMRRGGRPE